MSKREKKKKSRRLGEKFFVIKIETLYKISEITTS